MLYRSGKSFLLSSVALLGLSAQVAATAQEAAEGEERDDDVIVVSGIRQSLEDSAEAKRNSDNVADYISIDDVGDLPALNIADNLEYLPGAVGLRFRGTVDQVYLRGLPQLLTLTSFNDREVASSNGVRFVRFQNYPSSFFKRVEVNKAQTASIVEGGVAGTIVLETPSPLDDRRDDLQISASYRAEYAPYNDNNDLIDNWGGQAILSLQDKVDIGKGELGWLFTYDYHDNKRVISGLSSNPVYDRATFDGQDGIIPAALLFQNDTENFVRNSLLGVVEWEPSDSLRLKGDLIISHIDDPQERTFFLVAGLINPARYVDPVFSDGGQLLSTGLDNVVTQSRRDSITQDELSVLAGLNIQKDIGRWSLELDGSYSQVEGDLSLRRVAIRQVGMDTTLEVGDDGWTIGSFAGDLSNTGPWQGEQLYGNNVDEFDSAWSLSAKAGRELNTGIFTNFQSGIRYSNRRLDYFRDDEDDRSPRGNPVPEELYVDPYINFNPDHVPGGLTDPFATFDAAAAWDYFVGLTPTGEFVFDADDSDLLQYNIDNEEKTVSGFAELSWETKLGRFPIRGVAGVRALQTDLTAKGFSGELILTENGSGGFDLSVGGLEPDEVNTSYTDILPSINATMMLTNDLLVKFGAGRAIARPNFNELRLARNLNVSNVDGDDIYTGSAGNPYLDPITSNQLDLSLEWYGENTTLTGGYYYKDIDGFIQDGLVQEEISGYTFDLDAPKNLGAGEFSGFEVTARHNFVYLPAPFDGLGFYVAATKNYFDGDLDQYPALTETDAQGEFVFDPADREYSVDGFAPTTFSSILYFESGPASIRAGYKTAGEIASDIAGRGSVVAPQVRRAKDILDISASFDINERVSLDFQASNLTYNDGSAYYFFEDYSVRNQQTGQNFFVGITFQN
ncbi:TonB-dependent receptor [Parvularcula flava]|uniref:TonB-dependent receptor n=1 Tax=Aquisalinus luteolus TaxID=1566827 RepID=A0A8J3EPZ7_9PROT|nr:TonB-dependent receptor [Aquisalinus luteolus]NHK26389.1 TonB-dependent receptor [Aquisalinus luteolus]GGH92187.1 TonB-dependent receptor [Aquisalinus luteolus]